MSIPENDHPSSVPRRSCCSNKVITPQADLVQPVRPDLPPIPDISTPGDLPVPIFSDIPPLSRIASIAGSGCTCGVECSCPGCEEHRGEYVDPSHGNCGGSCGTCVDRSLGISLPGNEPFGAKMIDDFFRRAAALPAPPANNRLGTQLDPKNVMVYPVGELGQRRRAFGLVSVPRLKCCGGRCGCPPGQCTCGRACDGCCEDHSSSGLGFQRSAVPENPAISIRSCCS
jgi:hypothetical protein